ncbi:hypothetical protein HGG78_18835 [Vibrio aestuarianus]|uniref:hypothetical protein n=1 Tax=Vibrio aestuarianus TaxID=28171 RepID=UPI001559776B|nr:hypothetical protein [Vibrio aestuarianus]NGZ15760.1 hypothetical protein [Vibrio aestuarianus]NKZ51908.1 hypothetical protein [Vibrio aestuarianus]
MFKNQFCPVTFGLTILIFTLAIGNVHRGFKSAFVFEKTEANILNEIVSIDIQKQLRSDFAEKEIGNDDPYCLKLAFSKNYMFSSRGFEHFFPKIESGYCSNNEAYYHNMPREILYQSVKKRLVFLEGVDKEKFASGFVSGFSFDSNDARVIDRINLIIDTYKSHIKHHESTRTTMNKGES